MRGCGCKQNVGGFMREYIYVFWLHVLRIWNIISNSIKNFGCPVKHWRLKVLLKIFKTLRVEGAGIIQIFTIKWVITIIKCYWRYKFWKNNAIWAPPTRRHKGVLYEAKNVYLKRNVCLSFCARSNCKKRISRGEEGGFINSENAGQRGKGAGLRRGLKIHVLLEILLRWPFTLI